ncbi:hypothetical protein CDD82_7075 [Ophiocordyceps australis]|uniref:Uncharacterized protein n=1 Tax=Ophiocordyceps australis TaxID=1399860 RepID=A0A2C5ZQI3_9HYPO|nr:hypothetical protein CDD82_7075 [Ophiocordyceps australis]
MGWVTEWVYDMADKAGLSCHTYDMADKAGLTCHDENGAAASSSAYDTLQQINQVVSNSPRWTSQWFQEFFNRTGATCGTLDDQAAGSSSNCSEAMEQSIAQEEPWIGELIQLLIRHLDVLGCDEDEAMDEDANLKDEMLRFLRNHFNLQQAQLDHLLRQGQDWMRLNFPDLYEILRQFTAASLAPETCLQQLPFGKRSVGENGES